MNKMVLISLLPLLVAGSTKSNSFNYANNLNRALNDKLPQMVTKTFNGDSKSQIGFTWRTEAPDRDGVLQVVEKSINDFSNEKTITKKFSNRDFKVLTSSEKPSCDTGVIYKCLIDGLKENTTYIYKVGSEGNFKEGSFKTSGTNEKFNFVHLSDPQGKTEVDYKPYTKMLAHVSEKKPEFLAFTGDFVDNGKKSHESNSVMQWMNALDTPHEYLKDTLIAPVSGNHENGDYQFSSRFNLLPGDGDDGLSGNYYSFTYNDAYFLGINTNDTLNPTSPEATGLSDEQMNFIKADLEKHKNYKWKFALMHKGIFDPGEHSSNHQYEDGKYHDYDIDKIRKQLVPIFDEYHIDVVFQGHDHLYSLSYPTMQDSTNYKVGNYTEETRVIDGNEYVMKHVENGTIYTNISTASGSKNYVITDYDKDVFFFEKEEGATGQMYSNYTIEGNNLYVDTYKYNPSTDESKIYYRWGLTKENIQKPDEEHNPPIDSDTDKKPQSSNKGLIIGLSVGVPMAIIGLSFAGVLIAKKRKGK